MEEKIPLKVVNFSNITLPPFVLNLLYKGPNFCFVNEFYSPNLELHKLTFIRSLRFKHHHLNSKNNVSTNNDLIFHKPTSADPPISCSSNFDKTLSILEDTSTPWINHKPFNKYLKAFNFLKHNKSITLSKADKGGALVILNNDQYEKLVSNHLSDRSTYNQIDNPLNEEIHKKIIHLVNDYLPCFTVNERNFLLEADYKTPYFYILPKIHKHKDIALMYKENSKSYIHIRGIDNLESRPIVSSINSPTEKLSHFIDRILKPLIINIPGYVKDSFHLKEILSNRIVDNSCLFISLDVNSLYTNITHELGIEAITFWLNRSFNNLSTQRFPSCFIIQSLSIILYNNNFKYQNKYYNQVSGTAMGTKVAPTYANLVMAFLEVTLFERCKTLFGAEIMESIKNNYFRYLDDILIIWDSKFGNYELFLDIMRNLNQCISFKIEINSLNTNFLDLTLIKSYNHIETDIFYKVTNSHMYLHFQSLHAGHVKRSIPYILAYRIHRLVSNVIRKEQRLIELKRFLENLSYPKNLINDAITKTYVPKPKVTKDKLIPFVIPSDITTLNITNSLFLPNIFALMDKNFTDYKLIKCRKQPPNLLQHLRFNHFYTVNKCNRPKCKTCDVLIEVKSQISIENHLIKINSNMNCNTKNVIYILFCNGCSDFYVGETGIALNLRINLHRNHINNLNYGFLPVSMHIRKCSKSFRVLPIYKLPIDSAYLRKKLESYFISILMPKLNA